MPAESISQYGERLCTNIDTTKPFALIGLSFGGIMAIEMSRLVLPLKTIIISSAATKYQLPWYIRNLRFVPLYKIIPAYFLKRPAGLFFKLFGIKTRDEKELLKNILKDTNAAILRWSIEAITHWNNTSIPDNLVHIHGNSDKLLPIRFVKADIVVEGGEHFMVYSKASEISAILNNLLI